MGGGEPTRLEPTSFLADGDAGRLSRALTNLARHGVRSWALTGGLAYEIHGQRLGLECTKRSLNDLDFVAEEFGLLEKTLVEDFLFRHVHPWAPPGKIMAQLIEPENALRMDVFRACGGTMKRTIAVNLGFIAMRIVALEDLVARAARLLLDLEDGIGVAVKHARQFVRFVDAVGQARMTVVWPEHRKAAHPATFQEAEFAIHRLLSAQAGLLITEKFSQDPTAVCPQCAATTPFPLANPELILSLLGYC